MGIAGRWFWQATPKELAWECEARRERQRQQRTRLKETAWLIAALSRTKKMPALKALIGEDGQAQTSGGQSWQHMKAIGKALANSGTSEGPSHRTQRSQPRTEATPRRRTGRGAKGG